MAMKTCQDSYGWHKRRSERQLGLGLYTWTRLQQGPANAPAIDLDTLKDAFRSLVRGTPLEAVTRIESQEGDTEGFSVILHPAAEPVFIQIKAGAASLSA